MAVYRYGIKMTGLKKMVTLFIEQKTNPQNRKEQKLCFHEKEEQKYVEIGSINSCAEKVP